MDADTFRIQTVQEYPNDPGQVIQQADEEQADNARPELATAITNLEQYDTIYLGYPNWWANLPMAMYTFLESYDLSGKTIIPFNTHGGSRLSSTVNTIEELQKNATVVENALTVSRNNVADSQQEVLDWLAEVNPN